MRKHERVSQLRPKLEAKPRHLLKPKDLNEPSLIGKILQFLEFMLSQGRK